MKSLNDFSFTCELKPISMPCWLPVAATMFPPDDVALADDALLPAVFGLLFNATADALAAEAEVE